MKIENLFVSVTISSAWRSPATDLRISEVDAGKLPGSVREKPAMFMERIQMVARIRAVDSQNLFPTRLKSVKQNVNNFLKEIFSGEKNHYRVRLHSTSKMKKNRCSII